MSKRVFNYCLAIILFACSFQLHAHPFLWKASGEQTFYLFGTIHLADPRVTELPTEVTQALDLATTLYTELDLSDSSKMIIAESIRLENDKSLLDLVPDSLQARINQILKSINSNFTIDIFEKHKIWVLAVTLPLMDQQQKFPNQLPLDDLLYSDAVKQGKVVGGLEGIRDQMDIFDSMSSNEQIRLLQDTVEFMEQAQQEQTSIAEESIEAYLRGDLDQLMTYLTSYMKEGPFYDNLMKSLMDDRNAKIVDTMLSLVEQNPEQVYFFAVGAGHFWGAAGINNLLQENGYAIEQIDTP